MRSAEQSRERLLKAATVEFASVGIAGARVDRIADASGVNKAQMYRWFSSKDDLFDAVFARHLDRIVDLVPLTPYDLPGYVVALYDSYLDEPELVRLASWYRLERVSTGNLLEAFGDRTGDKLAGIAQAQAEGAIVAGISPAEVYGLLIAIAGTWSPVAGTFTASRADAEADHERRREVLRGVTARALVPADGR